MTWFTVLPYCIIGFSCGLIVLGILTRPRHGYSPLVEPDLDAIDWSKIQSRAISGYQPTFHYGDKVTITSGVYEGMKATIDGEISYSGYPVWIDANGTVKYEFIPKKHLRLVKTPPQSVSAMILYHATEREPMPELTDARLRMIASMEESGMFSVEKAARFRNAALLHANGAVSHMEDALLFGEDIIATLPETRPTAREASEAMRVMLAALPMPDDLPISPYANDEIYEPDKPLYLR